MSVRTSRENWKIPPMSPNDPMNPFSPNYVPPPGYGSREWVRRHIAAGNRPVGVVDGLVINYVSTGYQDGSGRGMLCKVVGGSAEHPTVISLSPEEMRRAIWTVSRKSNGGRPGAHGSTSATGADESRKDEGPGATPWIAGGLLIGMAIALKAAEKRFA